RSRSIMATTTACSTTTFPGLPPRCGDVHAPGAPEMAKTKNTKGKANDKANRKVPDRREHGGLRDHYPWYLANRAVDSGTPHEVLDKFSGKVATRVPLVGAAEVRKAIVAAHRARDAMAAFQPDARRDVLEHCVRRFG